MEPLNDRSIRILRKVLKQGTVTTPLCAVERQGIVVVTNGAWLMEWPEHIVDKGCKGWARLLADQNHKKTKKISKNLRSFSDWRDQLFRKRGAFVDVEEEEPGEDHDRIVILHENKRLRFHHVNIEAAEMFVPDARFRLYKERTNWAPLVRLLVVYEGKHKVGVFTSDA